MVADEHTCHEIKAVVDVTYEAISTPGSSFGEIFGADDITIAGSGQGELWSAAPDDVVAAAAVVSSLGFHSVRVVRDGVDELVPSQTERSFMSTATSLVTGVDFVVVPTKDFDASVQFYGTVLGLPCSARYGKMPGAEFETGTVTLAVMATEEFGMGFSPNRNPIALHVEDYEAARAELESRGVTFTSDTIDSGVCHMAAFEDPDGNVLMIHHRHAPRIPLA